MAQHALTLPHQSTRVTGSQMLAAGFFSVTGLLLVMGGGAAVNLAFTPVALGVGICLFARSPTRTFLAFCWWLWMLTPLIRRVVDWQTGYHLTSPVMLAPFLTSLLAMISIWRVSANLFRAPYLPLSIIGAICVYGFAIGVARGNGLAASYALLTWLAPLAIAIHILRYRRLAAEMTAASFTTLTIGAVVMGIYGIVQYVAPPPWDIAWILAAEMNSIGQPVARELRVFSTMNSPGPFALAMMAAFLMLFAIKPRYRFLAALPILAGLGLALVRSAWGGAAFGLLYLLMTARGLGRRRHAASLALLVAMATPLLFFGPLAGAVGLRMQSLAQLEQDTSFTARMQFHAEMGGSVLGNVFGEGLGATGLASRLSTSDNSLGINANFDSGVLDLLFTFGWAGALVLLVLFWLAIGAFRAGEQTPQGQVANAIGLSVLTMMLFSNTLTGSSGMLVFPMLALAFAQAQAARHQP